jgi:hypothetical protein
MTLLIDERPDPETRRAEWRGQQQFMVQLEALGDRRDQLREALATATTSRERQACTCYRTASPAAWHTCVANADG